jgi:hypothetical protein
LQLSPGQMTVGGYVGTTGFQHSVHAGHCTETGNSGAQKSWHGTVLQVTEHDRIGVEGLENPMILHV